MKLYNTLDHKYHTIGAKHLNIYACGPTIYDHVHLGNLRPILLTDLLIRYLEYHNYTINFLQNITDVDDKIINKALETQQTEQMIAAMFKTAYLDLLKQLNIRMPNHIIAISEKIPSMQAFIDALLSQKAAYNNDGEILFNIKKYQHEYGKLSNVQITNLISQQNPQAHNKQNAIDFSLWKKTTQGVNWTFHQHEGRPGWHTECAALIDEYFNSQTIDIHIGGIDLQFPHHENERIQFIAKNHHELAKIWMHNGHLTINHIKMSKSLKNVTYAQDFLHQYGVNAIKWIFLTTHYKQPINLSDDLLQQAQKFEQKIHNVIKKLKVYYLANHGTLETQFDNSLIKQFEVYMNDDLNTPQVLSLIDDILNQLNKSDNWTRLNELLNSLQRVLTILGFDFDFSLAIDEQTRQLFIEHQKLVKEKNFVKADQLRAELIKRGIL